MDGLSLQPAGGGVDKVLEISIDCDVDIEYPACSTISIAFLYRRHSLVFLNPLIMVSEWL